MAMVSFNEAARFRGPLGRWKRICLLTGGAIVIVCVGTFALAARLWPRLDVASEGRGRYPVGVHGAVHMKDPEGRRAEEIIERAAEAMGGPERYAHLTGMIQRSLIRMRVSGTELVGRRVLYTQFRPYRFKMEQKLLGKDTALVFDGREGWLQQNGQRHSLPPPLIKGIQGEMERSQFLMNYKKTGYTVRYLGVKRLHDRHETHEIYVLGPSGSDMTVFIDLRDHYLRGYRFQEPSTGGDAAVYLDDYTRLGDYAFPLRVNVYLNGEKTEALEIDQIEINPELDAGIFKPPREGAGNP
jgi:hypothetical protein